MALIEVYHVVADQYPVDPDTNPNLKEGMVVNLNSSGNAVKASNTGTAFGIAGDSSETSGGHTPYAADLVIGAHGPGDSARTRSTGNRASDLFDETGASGLVTVYNAGGKFHTDQYETSVTYTVGETLYSSANGLITNASNSSNAPVVGLLATAPRAYPSGVPGTETADGSLSLGTYLTFVLRM